MARSGPPQRPPAAAERSDPLDNPLRGVVSAFSCVPCGSVDEWGLKLDDGKFRCRRCFEEEKSGIRSPRSHAYSALIYGDAPRLVLGALVLGYSLEATGTLHDRVLLHTADVPQEALTLLAAFWRLQEVPYIISAPDLHNAPYEKARFKEVFTKLNILNPKVMPYDKVVFLDLDMVVLRNIDELFELRPPAAMNNMKMRWGRAQLTLVHGERMKPRACMFNAGNMVMAPSQLLFDLLLKDVQYPDPLWHKGAWSPEQSYLASILAGQWHHVSQIYNFEVQLHPGVPLSKLWECAQASDIAVAHFSGAKKVWDCAPEKDVSVVGSPWVRQAFARLPPQTRGTVALRCQVLHVEWHRSLALALQCCQSRCGASPELQNGSPWAVTLCTGDLNLSNSTAVQCLDEGRKAGVSLGDEVVIVEDKKAHADVALTHVATVVRLGLDGSLVLWRTPLPDASVPFCAGHFGLCRRVDSKAATAVAPLGSVLSSRQSKADKGTCGTIDCDWVPTLGSQAIAWLYEGHVLGKVVAVRGDKRLLRFGATARAPFWFSWDDLLSPNFLPGEEWQCVTCLSWRTVGSFDRTGAWRCEGCSKAASATLLQQMQP